MTFTKVGAGVGNSKPVLLILDNHWKRQQDKTKPSKSNVNYLVNVH